MNEQQTNILLLEVDRRIGQYKSECVGVLEELWRLVVYWESIPALQKCVDANIPPFWETGVKTGEKTGDITQLISTQIMENLYYQKTIIRQSCMDLAVAGFSYALQWEIDCRELRFILHIDDNRINDIVRECVLIPEFRNKTLNLHFENGNSLLHYALLSGNIDRIKMMIENGADPSCEKYGESCDRFYASLLQDYGHAGFSLAFEAANRYPHPSLFASSSEDLIIISSTKSTITPFVVTMDPLPNFLKVLIGRNFQSHDLEALRSILIQGQRFPDRAPFVWGWTVVKTLDVYFHAGSNLRSYVLLRRSAWKEWLPYWKEHLDLVKSREREDKNIYEKLNLDDVFMLSLEDFCIIGLIQKSILKHESPLWGNQAEE